MTDQKGFQSGSRLTQQENLRGRKMRNPSLGLPLIEAPEEEAHEQLANDFVARVIQEYERILEQGLPPSRAIASLVGWASGECQRIRN
jgi:hypothetical protein